MKRVFPPAGVPAVISHNGEQIAIPADGRELPDEIVEVFVGSHGFTLTDPAALGEGVKIIEKIVEVVKPENNDPNAGPESENIDEMSRKELFASLKALGVGVQLPKSNDDLRAILKQALEARQAPAPAPAEPAPPQAGA